MRRSHLITLMASLFSGICCATCINTVERDRAEAAGERSKCVDLPFTSSGDNIWQELYVVGGYHSVDNGCPAWGTANDSDIRLIGDEMGSLNITYSDGTADRIPLIFGYTMWYRANWLEPTAPLKGDDADPELAEPFRRTLMLRGAYEGDEACVLRVRLRAKPVSNIRIEDNPAKNGTPVFNFAFLTDGSAQTLRKGAFFFSTDEDFFDSHAVDPDDPFPADVAAALDKLRHALYTYEDEYEGAPEFRVSAGFKGPLVSFEGNCFARIASGVVYENLVNLAARVDSDGFLHTSYKGAPSWRYDGFGVWVENADSYYDSFYSRDGGRAIMSLLPYGYTNTAENATLYADRQMMYFPEQGLTFNGAAVPGHYTVIVNKPMIYPEILVPQANWPTSYTRNKFGDDYANLGNQETDGHGLMMLANYTVWRALGSPVDWVGTNWTYIREGAAWIDWCFAHPDISLVKNGLLYAESEAGMKEYTLYCNVPCYLGLRGYAEMAKAAEHDAEAASWNTLADNLRAAIIKRLSGSKGWNSKAFGFYHDPVLTMMSDMYGYDVNDMDPEFVELSRLAYAKDTGSADKNGWFGPAGIGYDHSMLTQNALLTDNMADATRLMENLSRISYAPGLPSPYLVPEGVSVVLKDGIIRRQGDLGNLVQLAEALKCYSICIGVSPVVDSTLKLLPRLPEGWSETVFRSPLTNVPGMIDLAVTYPAEGLQTAQFRLADTDGLDGVKLRLGPYPADTKFAAAQLNGQNVPCELVESGDSAWVWVNCPASNGELQQVAVIYGNDENALPAWPDNWPELTPLADNTERNSRRTGWVLPAVIGGAAAVAAASAAAVIIARKKSKS